jgi:hypothetical protein
MARAALSAIRFWAYPTMVIALWVVVSAFSLTQLATVLPSLASPAPVQQPFQDRAYDRPPRGCADAC